MSEENPYSAPAVTAAPVDIHTPFRPISATHGLRFANFIVDQIIVYVVNIAVGVGMIIAKLVPLNAAGEPQPGLTGIFVNLAFMMAYFTICEGVFGKTVGKLLTGTRVVGEEGRPIPVSKALLRSLCRMIPFEPFSFLGSDARGWHDSITKTWVIKSR